MLLKPYKEPLPTGKKPGSSFCAAKPPKKILAAESYYAAVGISLKGLAIVVHICKPPLLEQGASRFLDEALGFRLQSKLPSYIWRLESSTARVLCASVFVLGLVVLSRGSAKRERYVFTGCWSHGWPVTSRALPEKGQGRAGLSSRLWYIFAFCLGA